MASPDHCSKRPSEEREAGVSGEQTPTRADLEDFLFMEADLLDEWRLDEWLALWTEDGRYLVPSTDRTGGHPDTTLAMIADDMTLLRARVKQLLGREVWAEIPHSRTRRTISNVRVLDRGPDELRTTANFIVHRCRHDRTEAFVGKCEYVLVWSPGNVRIRAKKVLLSHESLSPHGKISIIL
jgi:p-cumate 2,3-dioxygenase beta subunit